jgi:hypothetical protein
MSREAKQVQARSGVAIFGMGVSARSGSTELAEVAAQVRCLRYLWAGCEQGRTGVSPVLVPGDRRA